MCLSQDHWDGDAGWGKRKHCLSVPHRLPWDKAVIPLSPEGPTHGLPRNLPASVVGWSNMIAGVDGLVKRPSASQVSEARVGSGPVFGDPFSPNPPL